MTELQGYVQFYTLEVKPTNKTTKYPAGTQSALVDNLSPNSPYSFTVRVTINGGSYIVSDPVTVKTKDGGTYYEKITINRKNCQLNKGCLLYTSPSPRD